MCEYYRLESIMIITTTIGNIYVLIVRLAGTQITLTS